MKVLFLPHCLRNLEQCPNSYGNNGLICNSEHDCSIGRLKKYAEDINYEVYILPGGSLLKKIMSKLEPDYVVGVACDNEIILAERISQIPHISIKLNEDGCIDTLVDEKNVMGALDANK